MGFIIGGPTLEPDPLGLGLRSGPSGHYLETLGLLRARGEAREVSDRLDACFLMWYPPQGIQGKAQIPVGMGDSSRHVAFAEELLASSSEEEDPEFSLDETSGWASGSVPVLTPTKNMSPVLLMADDVSLGPGEAAMVPAALQVDLTGQVQILPNSYSMVRCANGVWELREGMVLIINKGPQPLTLCAGDVVGAAWKADLPPPVVCGPEGELQKGVDAVNHIEQDERLIERMFETELPPEEYYTLLRADMERRHSNAAPEVLDHLLSTEMLLDVATVTGFIRVG